MRHVNNILDILLSLQLYVSDLHEPQEDSAVLYFYSFSARETLFSSSVKRATSFVYYLESEMRLSVWLQVCLTQQRSNTTSKLVGLMCLHGGFWFQVYALRLWIQWLVNCQSHELWPSKHLHESAFISWRRIHDVELRWLPGVLCRVQRQVSGWRRFLASKLDMWTTSSVNTS